MMGKKGLIITNPCKKQMKEAMHYIKKKDKTVQCNVCPWNCVINEGKRGVCGVRENQEGKLIALVYGRPVSIAVDPIEKKPLFHFLPGTNIFSIGTVGCNLRCKHCQNWEISQEKNIIGEELMPEQVIEQAIANECQSIAYTYNEPTIFYEYVYDTARLARKKGLKNVMVTNGYINKEPLEELYPYIDAANVDLKGFSEKFYSEITGTHIQPVLDTIKRISKTKTWMELTNLVIPTINDDLENIREMSRWIIDNIGKDHPLHFSRFFPYYKLSHLPPTPPDTLTQARKTAIAEGLHHVYIGNLLTEDGENTRCPRCGELVIERKGYAITKNKLVKGNCSCGQKIAGIWQ